MEIHLWLQVEAVASSLWPAILCLLHQLMKLSRSGFNALFKQVCDITTHVLLYQRPLYQQFSRTEDGVSRSNRPLLMLPVLPVLPANLECWTDAPVTLLIPSLSHSL